MYLMIGTRLDIIAAVTEYLLRHIKGMVNKRIIADATTKPLARPKFEGLVSEMGEMGLHE